LETAKQKREKFAKSHVERNKKRCKTVRSLRIVLLINSLK
jgi:hypothetical protein